MAQMDRVSISSQDQQLANHAILIKKPIGDINLFCVYASLIMLVQLQA